MNESRRQKRIASLIKKDLSLLLIEIIQDSSSCLITITGIEMSKDLKTARILLSIFPDREREAILELINKRTGYLRKTIASKTKLKYNPLLIFSLDPSPDYERRIDKLISNIKNDEK